MQSQFITYQHYQDILQDFIEYNDLYHNLIWLDLIQEGFNVKIKPILTISESGTSLAVTPFMVTNKGPFKIYGSPMSGLYTEFLGPIYNEDVSKNEKISIIRSQHNLLIKHADYIEWGARDLHVKNIDEFSNFEKLDYEYRKNNSLLLDLSKGNDEIWKGMSGNARNMVRKAEKHGVRSDIIEPNSEWIESYYLMLEQTFAKQGRKTPHPISFFMQLLTLVKEDKALFISSSLDGEVVANAIFLFTRDRMFYLSGTSNKKGLKSASNSSIQWKAIETAITKGISHYDMGGLGVESIDRFKRSFGGIEITHHRWIFRKKIFQMLEPLGRLAFRLGFVKF